MVTQSGENPEASCEEPTPSHNLIAVPFGHFERGKHCTVNCIEQLLQFRFASALDYINSK